MIHQVLQPIEGDGDSVRALAAALMSGAARLDSMNRVLVRIRSGATWDSSAGELFEAAVQESPPILDALCDRYVGAAQAMRTFADSLDRVQERARVASERHAHAVREDIRLEAQATAAAHDPARLEELRRCQGEVQGQLREAVRLHASAWVEFTEADHRLAGRLRELGDDILDDPWLYTVLAKLDRYAEETSVIPAAGRKVPLLNAVATSGEAAGVVSGAGLMLLYGEGSWKQVGINAASGAATRTGRGLRTGAVAGAQPASRLADGKRVYAGGGLSGSDRLAVGMRSEMGRMPGLSPATASRISLARDPIPFPKLTGLTARERARRLRDFGSASARRKADDALLDDVAAASAGGVGARAMFVAGATLPRVPGVVEQARSAREGRGNPDPPAGDRAAPR